MDGEERSVVCSIGEWVDQTGEERKGWRRRDIEYGGEGTGAKTLMSHGVPPPPLAPPPSPSLHWPLPPYLTRACTMLEHTVGEVDMTTMG